MPTLEERVQGAIDTLLKDQRLFHQVVHGSKTTEVTTEGGKVKSLAKAVGDLETSATRSATAAAGSATQSAGSATSAAGSASTATTQASNAAQSATAAAGSATQAQASATKAGASESAAAASATAAASSQTAAKASETNAAASAVTAQGAAARVSGRFATQAQAEAGTDDSHLMTPERTAQAIAALATDYSPTAVVHADNVSVGRVNDYRSGNSARADILQLARSSDFDLTGIADGVAGKELRVQCTGGGDVTLVHNSTHSAAGNRIWLSPSAYPAGEVKLQQGDTATLLCMRYNASVGNVWVLTGVTQAAATPGGLRSQKVFATASGRWIKPAGIRRIKVFVTGGGGGTVLPRGNASGGGGGGGTAIKIIDVSSIYGGDVSLGSGGFGAVGGNSSFVCVGHSVRGLGGGYGFSGNAGLGGEARGGDINLRGGDGGIATNHSYVSAVGGNGGSSFWGGGGMGANAVGNPHPARRLPQPGCAPGSGSGGCGNSNRMTQRGATGIVVIEECE